MDTIGNMLTSIKNALRTRKETIDVPFSKIKEQIVRIMVEEGYIRKYDVFSKMNKKFLRITLKYNQEKKGVIRELKRVSKPGRRIYVEASAVPMVQNGFGTAIISTPKGVLTGEEARRQRVGGEVICYIW